MGNIFSSCPRHQKKPTTMKLLVLASLASFGLAAPQNSFFVLTRGSGVRETTSYIDYSTGLRTSARRLLKLTSRASSMAAMPPRQMLLLPLLTRLLPGPEPLSHLEVPVKLPRLPL